MKTLLFNGCSFVAGMDIGWDDDRLGAWNDPKNNQRWELHRVARKEWNLSAKCANRLSTTAYDVSVDGSCNFNITMQTIKYIQNLSESEKLNLHVCIGWTEPHRFNHYLETHKDFFTINPVAIINQDPWTQDSFHTDFFNTHRDLIVSRIQYLKDIDLMLTFISEVSWLENFLLANNITYTFWKSLGWPIQDRDKSSLSSCINFEKITNHNAWIKLDNIQEYPLLGITWGSLLVNDSRLPLTKTRHPSKLAIEEFSVRICENICQQLLKV
jgi:hypothetical protein